jgi:membrane-associated phospholipid phosphatase
VTAATPRAPGEAHAGRDGVLPRQRGERRDGEEPGSGGRRGVRPWHVGLAVYAVALGWYLADEGFPLDRYAQILWIGLGMAAAQVGRPWRAWRRMLLDWVPFFGALVVYDHTRGVADTLGRPVLLEGLVDAEAAVFGGQPVTLLQEEFYDPSAVHWYDVVASLVYFSHFFAAWVIAAALYVASRRAWVRYARRLFTLTFAGLATYVLLPAAPPWYAAHVGLLPPVERAATRGWWEIGVPTAGRLVERGQADVNLVAALPSLHAGTSMLIVLWAWPLVRWWWARALLAAYALSMGVTLVYGGEHYVLDVLLGWAYAAAAVLAARAWERRRSAPDRALSAGPPAAGSPRPSVSSRPGPAG